MVGAILCQYSLGGKLLRSLFLIRSVLLVSMSGLNESFPLFKIVPYISELQFSSKLEMWFIHKTTKISAPLQAEALAD